MTRVLYISLCICVAAVVCHGISTKMDFGEEDVEVETNSTKVEDEDLELKHTIIVSTKLKNNNRRGLHSSNDGGTGTLTFKSGGRENKDSGEVPVVSGYKAVESTLIKTPDTRLKNQPGSQTFPESVFINRNIHDEYDIYPNYITNPSRWQPSTFYNNINWQHQELPLSAGFNTQFKNTFNSRPAYQTPGKFHRGITNDGMKEFYCNKCRELQGFRDCGQQRNIPWSYTQQTTTPKIKLDGKLAKLN